MKGLARLKTWQLKIGGVYCLLGAKFILSFSFLIENFSYVKASNLSFLPDLYHFPATQFHDFFWIIFRKQTCWETNRQRIKSEKIKLRSIRNIQAYPHIHKPNT